MAIRDVLAKPAGNWSGCHSVTWDANAPGHMGDRPISKEFTKSGYPLGLMLNMEGDRFADESVHSCNSTYAIFGKAIFASRIKPCSKCGIHRQFLGCAPKNTEDHCLVTERLSPQMCRNVG